ncbi:hypothetical protein CAI21_08335 [Alkalilimnicola ehrlichii]|uniref:Metal-dependent hydrolase n=1 Tax=Alkalilimnicola ehrlichii TaxID=351052 RepID=A0A3E0WTV3_9GAMM|nr:metal-dependent hydrolase [Alkalilimnicola ehrlichii]RFA29834.1 hypothetical protein CAI21_08335 [Alkalilimnicola ehrlichii]RFA36422.1 hypothetical protein CAL65_10605 [Alkalilimnicola ehrlichii]
MDSLSHILLGGAIGNAVLGRRIGNKAILWGAAISLVPDIDVPIGAMMSDLNALTFHRGITHSLLFIALLTPLLGWALSRLYRRDGVSWVRWSLLCGLVLLSHLVIDAFTSYGIQLFLPFDNTAFTIASISVIDPLFTLPLLIAVPIIFFLRRERPARQWLGYGAMALSAAYLGFTLINKIHVQSVFEEQLHVQGIQADRLFVKPTLFNNILWRGIAETDDRFWVGFHSRLDSTSDIEFKSFRKNHHLLRPFRNEEAVRRLDRVSNGYFKVERRSDGLYVHDMRYGQAFEFMETERDFVFSYRLVPDPSGRYQITIETIAPEVERERDRDSLQELWERILGR